jgi:hypothetical protein
VHFNGKTGWNGLTRFKTPRAAPSVACAGKDLKGFKQGGHEGKGKTDDVEVAALNPGDPPGGSALDCVSTCLVHRFSGRDIGFDLAVGEGKEADSGDFGGDLCGLRSYYRNAGDDVVRAAGELPQHAHRIGRVFGFGKDLVIESDGGIGTEDDERIVGGFIGVGVGSGRREFTKNGLSFLTSETSDICDGSFSGKRVFGDVRGMNGEGEAGLGK